VKKIRNCSVSIIKTFMLTMLKIGVTVYLIDREIN